MGILDGIVEWIAEQVMSGLDLINTSVLGLHWAATCQPLPGIFRQQRLCTVFLLHWQSESHSLKLGMAALQKLRFIRRY